jgi:hypothetical protein
MSLKKVKLTGMKRLNKLFGWRLLYYAFNRVKNELNNGSLQIVPVKGLPIKSNWNLIWLKKFSPVAAAYWILFKMKRKELLTLLLNGLRIKNTVIENRKLNYEILDNS